MTTAGATDAPRTSSPAPRSTGRGNSAEMERLGLRTRTQTETQTDTEAPWTGFLDFVSGGDWLEPYCDHPDAVCRLQEFLQERALYHFDIDGKFWDYTAAGVRSFQGANGLETDARVGPKTAAAIDRAMGGAAAGPAAAPAPATEAAPEATESSSTWGSISALVADVGSLSRASEVAAGSTRAAAVARIHEALAELGYASTDPSGTFGDATHAAVVSFQGDHGRRTDGEVGPRTAGSLDHALAAGSTSQTPSSTTAPPSSTEISTDAASARALVLEVLAWSKQRTRYDTVYDQGEQGVHLRDWMATHRGDARQYGKHYTDASGAQAAAPTQVGADVQGENPGEVRAYPAIPDASASELLQHVANGDTALERPLTASMNGDAVSGGVPNGGCDDEAENAYTLCLDAGFDAGLCEIGSDGVLEACEAREVTSASGPPKAEASAPPPPGRNLRFRVHRTGLAVGEPRDQPAGQPAPAGGLRGDRRERQHALHWGR